MYLDSAERFGNLPDHGRRPMRAKIPALTNLRHACRFSTSVCITEHCRTVKYTERSNYRIRCVGVVYVRAFFLVLAKLPEGKETVMACAHLQMERNRERQVRCKKKPDRNCCYVCLAV